METTFKITNTRTMLNQLEADLKALKSQPFYDIQQARLIEQQINKARTTLLSFVASV